MRRIGFWEAVTDTVSNPRFWVMCAIGFFLVVWNMIPVLFFALLVAWSSMLSITATHANIQCVCGQTFYRMPKSRHCPYCGKEIPENL